ncbi:MAG: YkgJ family cysteine cluster protein [Methanomassiliicoccales archaeon]
MPGVDLPLDLSELQGQKFVCIDNCSLCCLCQPELLSSEEEFFRRNYPQKIIIRKFPHKHTALAMKNGFGPCTFLEHGRCTIYSHRPHFCRQFPFHVHLMERVQFSLDLSCRGVWEGRGEDASALGLKLALDNETRLLSALNHAKRVHQEFLANCKEAGLVPSPRKHRIAFESVLQRTSELGFLGWILDRSMEEEEMNLLEHPSKTYLDDSGLEELRKAAMEVSLESLASEDPMYSPVYCSPEGRWNLFLSSNGGIEIYRLLDDGNMERERKIDPNQIPLLPPEAEGKELFSRYLGILNRRDSLLGHAYYLMDEYGYEDYFPNVFYGVLASSGLDLLWRASLLAYISGGRLDWYHIREGIIFYDMDRLDAPTIGAFV